jgi:hypothetical protein
MSYSADLIDQVQVTSLSLDTGHLRTQSGDGSAGMTKLSCMIGNNSLMDYFEVEDTALQ